MSSVEDRRTTTRFPRRLPVRYWARGAPDQFHYAYTRNLSAGGVFISCQQPFRKTSRIQIEFATAAGRFVLDGLVIRSSSFPRELQKVKSGGMGVRFITVAELIAEALPSDPVELDAPPPPPILLESLHATDGVIETEALIGTVPLLDMAPPREGTRGPEPAFRTTRLVARSIDEDADRGARGGAGSAEEDELWEEAEWEYEDDLEEDFDEASSDDAHEATSDAENVAAKRSAGRHRPLERHRDHRITFETCLDFLAAYNSELRYGRLFVATSDPSPPGSTINLVLDLPAASRQLRVTAKVYFVRREQLDGNPAEIGMKIRVDSESSRERITRLARAAEEMHLALPRA